MRTTFDSSPRWSWGMACVLIALASGPAAAQQFGVDPEVVDLVEDAPPLATDADGSVLEGLRLFMRETFGGNGRVCASCHPPTNNFTIDPAFIRRLPRRDPLFVAEFDPKLRDLERPLLMRRFGLILENLDGFDKPGVMRSVPHTLGLSQSIAKDKGSDDRPPFPLAEMTGWSGDGSPEDGSLRNFALGAVMQHFPRTTERQGCDADQFNSVSNNCDFRIPNAAELDAMEAFQLFLGRQSEVNITPDSGASDEIFFCDDFVEAGRLLFDDAPAAGNTTRSCAFCHNNGGANDSDGNGRVFATGANRHPNAPACRARGTVPGDGGFGVVPYTTEDGREMCGTRRYFEVAFRGEEKFNTPSLIEAADTPPFFHNNIVDTIEEAVEFYTTDVFGSSGSGGGRPFILNKREIEQIAAMLRVLNALQNMKNGNRFDEIAKRQSAVRPQLAIAAVEVAASETEDAIEVLTRGPVELYSGTDVVRWLRRALELEERAIRRRNLSLLTEAVALKRRAGAQMIRMGEPCS